MAEKVAISNGMSRTQKNPKLSIIIPTYNEADRIADTLKQTIAYCDSHNYNYEIIVSDAESPDGTGEEVHVFAAANDRAPIRLIDAGPRQGKGRNVHSGLEGARGDYHVFMDADLATPLHHLAELMERLEAGIDVVIAERNLRKIHSGKRLFVSLVGNALIRLFALPGIHDSQCGFKGFQASASQLFVDKQRTFGWGFDIEYLVIARRHKLSLATITANDWYDPKEADGGMVGDGPLETAVKTFFELGKITFNNLRGRYS